MRKFWFAVLIAIFTFTASGLFAQNTDARRAEYNQLLKQRQELLAWSSAHPVAPRLVGMLKDKEAQSIRTRLYNEFFSYRQQDVSNFKKQLRQEIAKAKNVPFITFNTLPLANLQKLASNKPLLLSFLKTFPDNVANLADSYLTKLFKEDEKFEEMMVSYLLYLKTYNANPSAGKFSDYEKKQIQSFRSSGNMLEMYKALFSMSSRRAAATRKALAQKYVARSLAQAFM